MDRPHTADSDAAPIDGAAVWTYRRAAMIDGHRVVTCYRTGVTSSRMTLSVDDRLVAEHVVPAASVAAVKPMTLDHRLPDGRLLSVTGGMSGWWRWIVAVRLDGVILHQSHPGRAMAVPDRMVRMMARAEVDAAAAAGDMPGNVDLSRLKDNRWPIGVDIALGLLFFFVAKWTDLTTAALVGAWAGLALVVVQRFLRVDLLGGLAMFGIVMLLLSAGFSLAFRDDAIIQQRSTIVGVLAGLLFLGDGLLLQGRRLGAGMNRYLAYTDVDQARLAVAMGVTALAMAATNYVVATRLSKDAWLTYTTFVDIPVSMALALGAIRWARTARPTEQA